jgi:BirA family transcriptional regulator, biotin operon repressor / biotin---[acetyl-CoA-carboxylase] ligase
MPGSRLQGDRILRLLRETEGFVSGQEMCRRLGITRAAVWKQVERLRMRGFPIEGVSSLGYRLGREPEGLGVLEQDPGIRTVRIGKRIVVREETGSTNEDARWLGRQGAEEGTVVLAEAQTAGRGRMGRPWIGPARANLYLSVLLRPPSPPAEAAWFTLLAAVELCRTIRELFLLDARIKWPNDILLNGRKAAGILAEMEAEMERIHFIVLGIGVNLNMTEAMFPAEILYPATSVSLALGREVGRVDFARRLLESLDRGYDGLLREGPAPVREAWMRYSAHTGKPVDVNTPGGGLRGRFVGIDACGAMILETEGNIRQTIHVGDVVRVR